MEWSEIRSLVDDQVSDGWFSVNRAAFTRSDVFNLEMRHIYAGGWIFPGFESHVPHNHDYLTAMAGRVPVVVIREGEGKFGAFANACHAQARWSVISGRALDACPSLRAKRGNPEPRNSGLPRFAHNDK